MSRITYVLLYATILNILIKKSFIEALYELEVKKRQKAHNYIALSMLVLVSVFEYYIGIQNAGISFLIQVPVLIVMLGYITKKIKIIKGR